MLFKATIFASLLILSTASFAKSAAVCQKLFADLEISDLNSHEEELKSLTTQKIIKSKKGPAASEEGFILTLENGKKAFFKPIDLRADRDREIGYQSPRNEVAAYSLSELLGFHIVPPTILRTVDGRLGSLQMYIYGRTPDQLFKKSGTYIQESDLIWLFDLLIANIDRSGGNYIVTKTGEQWAIDNAASFFRMKNNLAAKISDAKNIEKIKNLKLTYPEVIAWLRSISDKTIEAEMKGKLKPSQIKQLLDRRRTLIDLINGI